MTKLCQIIDTCQKIRLKGGHVANLTYWGAMGKLSVDVYPAQIDPAFRDWLHLDYDSDKRVYKAFVDEHNSDELDKVITDLERYT